MDSDGKSTLPPDLVGSSQQRHIKLKERSMRMAVAHLFGIHFARFPVKSPMEAPEPWLGLTCVDYDNDPKRIPKKSAKEIKHIFHRLIEKA